MESEQRERSIDYNLHPFPIKEIKNLSQNPDAPKLCVYQYPNTQPNKPSKAAILFL